MAFWVRFSSNTHQHIERFKVNRVIKKLFTLVLLHMANMKTRLYGGYALGLKSPHAYPPYRLVFIFAICSNTRSIISMYRAPRARSVLHSFWLQPTLDANRKHIPVFRQEHIFRRWQNVGWQNVGWQNVSTLVGELTNYFSQFFPLHYDRWSATRTMVGQTCVGQ